MNGHVYINVRCARAWFGKLARDTYNTVTEKREGSDCSSLAGDEVSVLREIAYVKIH